MICEAIKYGLEERQVVLSMETICSHPQPGYNTAVRTNHHYTQTARPDVTCTACTRQGDQRFKTGAEATDML